MNERDCQFCPAPAVANIGNEVYVCGHCLDLIEVRGLTYDEVVDYYDDEHYEEYPNT